MQDGKIHSLKRPAIERMLRIHHALKRGGYPNCSSIAKELEVSTKTISRDIDFMRDRMLMPIEYESSNHGYYYTREVESMPTIDISEGELLALTIARKSLDHYKGTPFEKPLANALNKLSASLPDNITANLHQLSESISFKQSRQSIVSEDVLKAATAAALEKRKIRFSYKKPGSKSTESRTVSPYHLTNYLGKWYLIGFDDKRSAIRTFLLARASDATVTDSKFEIDESFQVDDYLWMNFGIYTPTGSQKVVIRFQMHIAEYIAENVWHPTQSINTNSDGSIDIEFSLKSILDVVQWVISWGESAFVIAPEELRQEIKASALRIAERYD